MTTTNILDIMPDGGNVNEHTPRGARMLRRSVRKFGPRGAGMLDKENRVVHGNHRLEVFLEEGKQVVEIIDADPAVPVFIQYPDLDLDEPTARELSLALNRTEEVGVKLSPRKLLDVAGKHDIGFMFTQPELDVLSRDKPTLLESADKQRRLSPSLRLIVPVEVYEKWLRLLQDAPGSTDMERASAVLLAMVLP